LTFGRVVSNDAICSPYETQTIQKLDAAIQQVDGRDRNYSTRSVTRLRSRLPQQAEGCLPKKAPATDDPATNPEADLASREPLFEMMKQGVKMRFNWSEREAVSVSTRWPTG